MHTKNSFDAFTIGVNQTLDSTYKSTQGLDFKQLLASLFADEPIHEYATPELRTSMWESFVEVVNKLQF